MSDDHSTRPSPSNKPGKPYPDFPLFAHANGQWAKKIRGKLHYFGLWVDPDGAVKTYLAQKDDLHAGRTPRPDTEALTIRDLLNRFLNFHRPRMETGEIAARTFADHRATCERIAEAFGKTRRLDHLRPDDFEKLRAKIAKQWGPVALRNEIQRIRSVFKYAYDAEMVDRPIRFGPGFKRPTKKTLRKNRAAKGVKMFAAEEIHQLMGVASIQVKAMILLGINAGYGNSDCATLPMKAIDLVGGWIDYARPKTGVARRCPLWPETVHAVREAIAKRPEPKNTEDAGLLFITKFKTRWDKSSDGNNHANPISWEMKKALKKLGLYRAGLGFYSLRHTFRTVADEAHDQAACDLIMGHSGDDMVSVYRERIGDDRLRAVTEHVRKWLFTHLKNQ